MDKLPVEVAKELNTWMAGENYQIVWQWILPHKYLVVVSTDDGFIKCFTFYEQVDGSVIGHLDKKFGIGEL